MPEPGVADWARLAAFIDGEGCLHAHLRHRTYDSFGPVIGVMNTSKVLMDWLQEKFGGHIYTRKPGDARWKVGYEWRVVKRDEVERVLLNIAPYLVIKRVQAVLLLALCTTADKRDHLRIAKELGALNARGAA